MLEYTLRRVLVALARLIGTSVAAFIVFFLLPGRSPGVLSAGPHPTPALRHTIGRRLGLSHPFYVQYIDYLRALVLHLDLGYSHVQDAPVRTLIVNRLPATVSLAAGAAIVAVLAGTALAALLASRRGSRADRAVSGVLGVAVSAPPYWVGLIVLYLFSTSVGRFAILPGEGTYRGLTASPGHWFTSLVMPWLVLGVGAGALWARQLRSRLDGLRASAHAQTARAAGLGERDLVRHSARAAIVAMLPDTAAGIGALLGGAVLIETVFGIPGAGGLLAGALGSGDLPVIQGVVILAAWFVVVATLIAELLRAALNPRVRATGGLRGVVRHRSVRP
jgi:peptide/nickel transport system permease protein